MYQNPTLEKLKQLRLNAMAELHLQNIQNNQSEKFTTDEYRIKLKSCGKCIYA